MSINYVIMPCKYHYFNILNIAEKTNHELLIDKSYLNRELYHQLEQLPEKCKTTPYFKTEINKIKDETSMLSVNFVMDREKDAIIKNCKKELSWKERLENWCNRKHYYLEK